MFSRIFSRKSSPAARRTTLGLESLGDRLMPSVTASVLPGGVLDIRGDAANDSAVIFDEPFSGTLRMQTHSNGVYTGNLRFSKSGLNSIQFDGGAGNDFFSAMPMNAVGGAIRVSSATGGAGDDILCGTNQNDVFHGSPGNDKYFGGAGADTLYRDGNRGYFADNAGDDQVYGMVTGSLSYGELTAPGDDLFAQINPTNAARMQLYGPSGVGFEVRAAGWTATDQYTSQPTYSGNIFHPITWVNVYTGTAYRPTGSTVYVETGRGTEVAIPAAAFPTISMSGHGRGVVTSNLGFSVLGDGVESLLDAMESNVGVSLDLPNVSGGLKLGSQLSGLDLPLAPAVPYFYSQFTTVPGVSVGGVSSSFPSLPAQFQVSVAVDPTDIGGLLKFKGGNAEFGLGWSQDG